jgi:hypothetical protein
VICGRFCAIRRPRNAAVGEYMLQYRSVATVVWVDVMRRSAVTTDVKVVYFAVNTVTFCFK